MTFRKTLLNISQTYIYIINIKITTIICAISRLIIYIRPYCLLKFTISSILYQDIRELAQAIIYGPLSLASSDYMFIS